MDKPKKPRDNVNLPLSWVVAQRSTNGAAGRPFPTLPVAQEKPKELPREFDRTAKGLKGGEDEC